MKIKNWQKFQHYKDRRPLWIKLYREILEHRAINLLSDCAFRVLVNLWVLASEDEHLEGNLPPIDEIAFRLRLEKPKVIKALSELDEFLEQEASNPLADSYQSDSLEKEKEKEKETTTSPDGDATQYETILKAYEKTSLPRVVKITKTRLQIIRARWREHPDPIFWADFWAEVESSDFLAGRVKGKGHDNFRATLEWCLKESNFVKIIEGNYANRQ